VGGKLIMKKYITDEDGNELEGCKVMNKKTVEKLETDIIHILKNIDYKEKGRNGVGYDFWKLKEIVTEKFNKLKGV
jgi:uncharacterized protein YdaL